MMVIMMVMGFISYWLMSVVRLFLFYHLTRMIQYNFSLSWVKNSNQMMNLYKITNHPLIWMNPTNWFIMVTLILMIFL